MSEQYYYIITKTERINNIVQETSVGCTDSEQDANTLNAVYDATFGNWIRANKPLLEAGIAHTYSYFLPNQKVYSARSKTTCIDGFNLALITDINTLV